MKFIILLALFAVAAARPNKPDLPRPPTEDKLQIIREKLAKIRDFINANRPVHVGAEPIDFDFDPTHPAVEAAPTPVSSPLVQIIVNVQGSDSGSVTSPVIVDGIERPSPVEFETEESEIYPTPVIIVEEAEDSHIEATPVIVVEEAEDSEIHPEQVIVVEHPHAELEPVDVVPIVAAPAVMAPDVL